MIKAEYIEVMGWNHAIRGMRNPLNSWNKSDTVGGEYYCGKDVFTHYDVPRIGHNDLDLMQRLFKGGTEHRKYLRMILVSMDITAPLYWWKEFDTYKVGTVANSCSTMHKIQDKKFTIDDFSHEHLINERGVTVEDWQAEWLEDLYITIARLNWARKCFLDTKNKKYWWQMIQLLPSSYNQKRTITMSYENIYIILRQRQGHKLDEWNDFCSILKDLPYIREIGGL